jgi:hypothetical protein
MHFKKAGFIYSFFLAVFFLPSDAVGLRIDPAEYPYPYRDPYVATATVALMQGREKLPSGRIQDLRIKVLDGRNDVPLLEGKGRLRYRFYEQERRAPLVFILPGLGSSAYAGSARHLAELLAGDGFHVLILPNPLNWNFTLAASRLGAPGLTLEDTQDLYSVMQLVLNQVRGRCPEKIGKIGVLGLSNGALYAGYIATLDSAQKKIGLDTYLLVNPPVDLLRAIRLIDEMAALGDRMKPEQREYLEAYAVGVVARALKDDPNDPEYFLGWDRRAHLTGKQIQYLVGKALQESVGEAIYVSDLAHNLGVLKTPISWGYRSHRLQEAESYTLMGYLKTFLIPRLRQSSDKQMNLDTFDVQTSLKGIEASLKNNPNIFLMHNLDDFLVSREDIEYLENVFGDRARIYPLGGHMGNLWYSRNRKDILDIFKGVEQ